MGQARLSQQEGMTITLRQPDQEAIEAFACFSLRKAGSHRRWRVTRDEWG